MNTNKNSYTFLFSAGLVVIIAALLAFAATFLKSRQQENLDQEKMQNILKSVGVNLSRAESSGEFSKLVKEQVAVDYKGDKLSNKDIFNLNLALERKKPINEQILPIYVIEKASKYYYVIPLHGQGLWDAIWGYIALESDFNTIYGANFDHKSETSGLGAEIAGEEFQKQFKGKKIFGSNYNLEFRVQKGGVQVLDKEKQQWAVDAISGGTLTSDGVTNMISERLEHYIPFFKKTLEFEQKQVQQAEIKDTIVEPIEPPKPVRRKPVVVDSTSVQTQQSTPEESLAVQKVEPTTEAPSTTSSTQTTKTNNTPIEQPDAAVQVKQENVSNN